MGEPYELNVPTVGLSLEARIEGQIGLGGPTDGTLGFDSVPRAGFGGRACVDVYVPRQAYGPRREFFGVGGSACYSLSYNYGEEEGTWGFLHRGDLLFRVTMYDRRLDIGVGIFGNHWIHPDSTTHSGGGITVNPRYFFDNAALRQYEFRPFVGGNVDLGGTYGGPDKVFNIYLGLGLAAGFQWN